MFDGNSATVWHSHHGIPNTGPGPNPDGGFNSITVTFKKYVKIFAIRIMADDKVPVPQRYQNICIFINDNADACTESTRPTS